MPFALWRLERCLRRRQGLLVGNLGRRLKGLGAPLVRSRWWGDLSMGLGRLPVSGRARVYRPGRAVGPRRGKMRSIRVVRTTDGSSLFVIAVRRWFWRSVRTGICVMDIGHISFYNTFEGL